MITEQPKGVACYAHRMASTPRHSLEATIAELAPGGDGVALCDAAGERRAIFVPGVAPGERVRLDVDLSRRPARGRLLAVLEPSPARVVPHCPHQSRCGACDWMHLSLEAQAAEHASIVSRVLPRAYRSTPITAHGARHGLAYRTRARLHVEAKGRGPVAVGMFGRGTHEPIEVTSCAVLAEAVERAREALPTWLAGSKGRGEARLSLGAPSPSLQTRTAVLDLRWDGDLPAAIFARLEEAVAAGTLGGARVFAGAVRLPATIGDPTPFADGPDGLPLRLGPGGFSQASDEQNRVLALHVAKAAEELAGDVPAVELYAGAGNFTVLLARVLSRLVTVEADREACDAARANLASRGLSARVVCADAAGYEIPRNARLVVLDPPRTGAKDVIRALADARRPTPALVYISCDPPTLGRDLGTLADAGYVLRSVDTFEMFPQTSHVETVAVLTARPRR